MVGAVGSHSLTTTSICAGEHAPVWATGWLYVGMKLMTLTGLQGGAKTTST